MGLDSDGQGSGLSQARHVTYLAAAELAGKVASFAMFVFAARWLGPGEFGQFSWSMNLALLLSTVAIWGFDIAIIQRSSRNPERLNELLSNTLLIRLMLAPIILIAAASITVASGQNVCVGLMLTGVMIADSITQAYRAGAAVLQHQGEIAVNLVVQRTLTAALAIGILAAGGGLLGMCLAYLGGAILGMAALGWSGRRIGLRPAFGLRSLATGRELLRGSTALGLNYTLNLATFRIGVLLLGWLTTDVEVGLYSVSYRMFEALLFVVWSVDRVALPAMAASEGDVPVRNAVHRSATVVLAVFVPYITLLLLRGGDVLQVAFGPPYDSASLISTQVLALSLLPYAGKYLLDLGLYARGRNRTVTLAAILSLLINVALSVALIPSMGANGAAVGTLVAFIIQAGIVWFGLVRVVGSPQFLLAGLVPSLAVTAIIPILLTVDSLPIAVAVCGVAYPVAWFIAARALDRPAFDVASQLLRRVH